jgi:hypothetical protein
MGARPQAGASGTAITAPNTTATSRTLLTHVMMRPPRGLDRSMTANSHATSGLPRRSINSASRPAERRSRKLPVSALQGFSWRSRRAPGRDETPSHSRPCADGTRIRRTRRAATCDCLRPNAGTVLAGQQAMALRKAVVIEHRLDALLPVALIDQRVTQADLRHADRVGDRAESTTRTAARDATPSGRSSRLVERVQRRRGSENPMQPSRAATAGVVA